MMRRHPQDQQSRVLYELSSLVFSLLRSLPSTIPFDADRPPSPVCSSSGRSPTTATRITAAGFASLMLGVSLTLMLCGSVTFFIGFLLIPWALGLAMVLYLAGLLSCISLLWRSIFCSAKASPISPKEMPCKD